MNRIIIIIAIPIILIALWWVSIKKSKKKKTKKLVIGLSVVLVLIEIFEVWACFFAPQYIIKEINGSEIYRTWNYDKALKVYHEEREKRQNNKIILYDEEWGNSLWDDN